MNLSTQSVQAGPRNESTPSPTRSQESYGNKATEDPILGVNTRADAQDILNARDDLSRQQKKHLWRVVLRDHTVVCEGQPKQDPSKYWARKFHAMNVWQLDKASRRLIRDGKILRRRLESITKHSVFARSLLFEQSILIAKAGMLNEEIKARRAPHVKE